MKDLSPGERLARAVLIFYSGTDWTPALQREWFKLTGKRDATTRDLGDMARELLAGREQEDADA